MGAGHSPARRAGSRHRGRLLGVFAMVLVMIMAEIVTGILTGSLALLSDAGHMATDALGLGMALAAIVAADTAGTRGGRTFGLYRAEILAALANAALLFGVAGYVLWEAIRRLGDPPAVESTPMLVVAGLGLAVNLIGWWLLRDGARDSINVEGAYLEVVADLAGSLGVVVAAAIIALTGWTIVDAIVGAAIGVFILPRAWRLGRRAIRILIQAAPEDLDLDRLAAELHAVEGVVGVHDLHVWTLTSDMPVASVHLIANGQMHRVLDRAQAILRDGYGVIHATLQVEPEDHTTCTELTW